MFTGDLARKTYGDLLAFLGEGLREGTRLEYKSDWTGNVEKTIAAMANTECGVILVGVDERDRRPVLPPIGVEMDGAFERVQSKAYEAIYEPLTPEIETIALADDATRGVVVVRVQPSERAPHAVGRGRTGVYRRVGAQAMVEGDLDTRMGVDRMEWLIRRRDAHAASIDAADRRRSELIGTRDPELGHFTVDVVARPVLAHATPLALRELRGLAQQRSEVGAAAFPEVVLRLVAGGLVTRASPRECYIDVTGLSAYGRTFNRKNDDNFQPPRQDVIFPQWLNDSVALIEWTGTAARAAGRGGNFRVTTTLRGVRGAALSLGGALPDIDRHRSLQAQVSAEFIASADEMASDPVRWALSLLRDLSHAFDLDPGEDELRTWWEAQ